MATASPGYNPTTLAGGGLVSTLTAPVLLDATGLTTTVPLLVSNAKTNSGIEVQVTGTKASGFDINDSSGVLKAALGYAVSANDWITGTGAGDIVIGGATGKFVCFGVIGGASVGPKIDLANNALVLSSSTSMSAVALQIDGDPNTGIGRVGAADTLSMVCGGNESLKLSNSAGTTTLRLQNAGGATYSEINMSAVGVVSGRVAALGAGVGGTYFGQPSTSLYVIDTAGNMVVGGNGGGFLILGTSNLERIQMTAAGLTQFTSVATVASAAGSVWDALDIKAGTLTLSGSTNITTVAGVNLAVFRAPTLTAASALTVTNAATVTILGPPVGAGAGPCTITNARSLWIQAGNLRLDGQLSVPAAQTQATIGANGAASALTAAPLGYLKVDVNGTAAIIPYYNA